MINDTALAELKAWFELYVPTPDRETSELVLRLIREVKELREKLNVELDLNTHLVGRVDELRAALRQINVIASPKAGRVADGAFRDLMLVTDQARAALGEG